MSQLAGKRRVVWVFSLLFVVGLALRAALLPVRWINPDEGPHLMDARLALEGQLPVADYGSRQPFYVAVLAGALKVFGVHLTSGRLVPLTCNLLTALLIFWFGVRLGGVVVGAVAGSLWLFAPLSLIWSAVVKTDPLAILLGAASMAFVWRAARTNGPVLWLAAGLFAGLAYYVRQATLYLPVAVAVFWIWQAWGRWKQLVKGLLLYAVGFVAVVGLAFAVYVPRMGLAATLSSQIDPANIVLDRLGRLLGVSALRSPTAAHSLRSLGQSVDMTVRYLREAVNLSAFLLPAWAFAVVAAISGRFRRRFDGPNADLLSLRLLVSWALAVVLLYTYHVSARGFFTQYATELYVPLILLVAWLWFETWGKVARTSSLLIWLGALAGFFGFAVLGRLFPRPNLLTGLALLASFVALAFLRLEQESSHSSRFRVVFLVLVGLVAWGAWRVLAALGLPGWISYAAALGFAVAVLGEGLLKERGGATAAHYLFVFTTATLFLSGFHTGMRIGPKYECIWSPRTLQAVKSILQKPEVRGQTVLSGGMIWTFESGARPYGNVTPEPVPATRGRGFSETTSF
ncbi:MAG: hypothetical protein GXO73_03605 [Calditrichaeota bacterium]|nr:hypothetical protein [Calditrichota bacterium]